MALKRHNSLKVSLLVFIVALKQTVKLLFGKVAQLISNTIHQTHIPLKLVSPNDALKQAFDLIALVMTKFTISDILIAILLKQLLAFLGINEFIDILAKLKQIVFGMGRVVAFKSIKNVCCLSSSIQIWRDFVIMSEVCITVRSCGFCSIHNTGIRSSNSIYGFIELSHTSLKLEEIFGFVVSLELLGSCNLIAHGFILLNT